MRIGKLAIGWSELDQDEIRTLGLDETWKWEAFGVEWGGTGFTLFARPTEYRFPDRRGDADDEA